MPSYYRLAPWVNGGATDQPCLDIGIIKKNSGNIFFSGVNLGIIKTRSPPYIGDGSGGRHTHRSGHHKVGEGIGGYGKTENVLGCTSHFWDPSYASVWTYIFIMWWRRLSNYVEILVRHKHFKVNVCSEITPKLVCGVRWSEKNINFLYTP